MVLGFTGFAQLVTPGYEIGRMLARVNVIAEEDFNQLIAKLCLEDHLKKIETSEKKYVFSLANLMVLFIVRSITQVRSDQNS